MEERGSRRSDSAHEEEEAGEVQWFGGPFAVDHSIDDYVTGLLHDEDWRGDLKSEKEGEAMWNMDKKEEEEEKKAGPLGSRGFCSEVVAFYCSGEAWKKPNLMHIVIPFFLYMLAFSYTTTVIPLVIAELCGGDVGKASSVQGYLSATYAAATLFTAALLGLVADRWGRVPCFFISLVGFGIDVAALAAAPVLGWGVGPLYATRAIGGACLGFFTAGYAYIADISTVEDRSKNFGTLGIAMGLGFLAGPTVAGYLGQFNLAIPLIVALGLTAVNVLFVGFVMVESKPPVRTPWQWRLLNPFRSFALLLQNGYALGIALAYFLSFLAEQGLLAVFVLYLKYRFGWGSLEVGFAMSVFGLTFCISQGVLTRYLLPWLGDRKTLLLAMLIDALSSWPYALVPNGFYLFPIMVVRSVALVSMPISQGIVSKQYSMAQQGELMGVMSGLKTITAFVGPLVYNSLFTYFTSPTAWPTNDPGLVYYVATANAGLAFLVCCLVFWLFPAKTIKESPLIDDENNEKIAKTNNIL